MLKQIIKAIHIERSQTNQKLPITIHIMRKMYHIVSDFPNFKVLWSAMTLAFFGCLRASEFTVKTEFDPSKNLCVSDVSIHNESNPP